MKIVILDRDGVINEDSPDYIKSVAEWHPVPGSLEAIARRSAYLSLLTEYPHTLERVIRMMHASGWAATFLTLHPILLERFYPYLDDDASGHRCGRGVGVAGAAPSRPRAGGRPADAVAAGHLAALALHGRGRPAARR